MYAGADSADRFSRSAGTCKNYLSPNRREFYKIMYASGGTGIFSIGTKSYQIDQPMIFFVHPNDIITWKRTGDESEGFICFFKRSLAEQRPDLQAVIDKYQLFADSGKNVLRLQPDDVAALDRIFVQMKDVDVDNGGALAEDAMMAYLQLVMIAAVKAGSYTAPDVVTDEFRQIYQFFQLLEKEVSGINYTTPVQIRTAKDFAEKLFVHPNYLNALLLRTDWTLQDIGYAIGYADQPNFSQFFKKATGMTPAEYRKNKGLRAVA